MFVIFKEFDKVIVHFEYENVNREFYLHWGYLT
jgi:hypothetical protein